MLLRGELTLWTARRLQVPPDPRNCGGRSLVAGPARVFRFEKGAAYYLHSHAFLMKFSLFIVDRPAVDPPGAPFPVVAQGRKTGRGPGGGRGRSSSAADVVHIELAAMAIILLCAAIMAKGGWV